jgi:hypothetical protein
LKLSSRSGLEAAAARSCSISKISATEMGSIPAIIMGPVFAPFGEMARAAIEALQFGLFRSR